MIYDFPGADEPIRQGDIFVGLPRLEISLDRMLLYQDDGRVGETNWETIAGSGSECTVLAGVRSVAGIVASQDCDLVRARDVMLCEIRQFRDVEKKCKETKEPRGWKSIITQQARLNLKWFYLPPDAGINFADKMAADFQIVLRVSRLELESRRGALRKGRLNDVSEAHFRERIAEFFRRYPYDEWYPLNSAEMDAYKAEYPEAQPFPWQKPQT